MKMRSLFLRIGGWVLAALGTVAAADQPPLEREILLDQRYLNVPVRADAPRRRMILSVEGRVVRAFEVELAEGKPDFWAFTDVSE